MTKHAKVYNKINKKDNEWLLQQERLNFSIVDFHEDGNKVIGVTVALVVQNDLKTYRFMFAKPCTQQMYTILKACNVHFRKALGFKEQGVCYFDDIDRLIIKANIKGHDNG
jgi:hypothetical protein